MPRDFPDWLNLTQPGARLVVTGNVAVSTIVIPAPGAGLAVQVYGVSLAAGASVVPNLTERTAAHVVVRNLWLPDLPAGGTTTFDLGGVILGENNEVFLGTGAQVFYTVVYVLLQVA